MQTIAGTRSVADGSKPIADKFIRIVDRWIFVVVAASFVLLALVGFVPNSLTKIAAVAAGKRQPFPAILHVHAVLMAAFMLLVLAQTGLIATGRRGLHRRIGLLGAALVPAIILVGVMLVPIMYQQAWIAAQAAPLDIRLKLQQMLLRRDDVLLLQLRMGILFTLFMVIGLRARHADPELHKRMMILGVATLLPPAINRMLWLPTTLPTQPLATDLYMLLALLPMFAWDIFRRRAAQTAYLVWFAATLPCGVAVNALWGSPWWHSVATSLLLH